MFRRELSAATVESLYVVGECPVGCGLIGVVVVLDLRRKAMLYSPCCGVAWRRDPGDEVDEVLPLSSLAPEGIVLPSLDEVCEAGYGARVLRAEPFDDWCDGFEGIRVSRLSLEPP